MRKRIINSLLIVVAFFSVGPAFAVNIASDIYEDVKKNVYQIRVVDLASGDKSSIGSGFQITEEGIVATNFHVVAAFVHKPQQFRLEYVYHDGSMGQLQLLDIDPIHDLALVQLEDFSKDHFQLFEGELFKGERIYSMGNPHDLGMTIIEGNYNGLIKTSRYQKILFSGSLNAGMSGGPAVNAKGEIIGINVSKGVEHISFLVPVQELQTLLASYLQNGEPPDFTKKIENQILLDQESFYKTLTTSEWESSDFMSLNLPKKLSESLKCWGHTIDEKDIRYEAVHQHCKSQDEIFINRRLVTGSFAYDYEWMKSDELTPFQFYNLLESRFSHPTLNNGGKKFVSVFECLDDFVEIEGRSWKVSSCIRNYNDYPSLYDVSHILVSVDRDKEGIVVKMTATGISQPNATTLLRKLLGALKWNQ